MELPTKSSKSFPRALDDALHIKRGGMGKQERMKFYEEVAAKAMVSPNTVASYATGSRYPQPKPMEAIAEVLGIEPTYFWEYRLHQIGEAFRAFPDLDKTFYEPIMRAYTLAVVESKAKNGNQAADVT